MINKESKIKYLLDNYKVSEETAKNLVDNLYRLANYCFDNFKRKEKK